MPSMVAFNSRVRGAKGDGSALVAVGEKERRPCGTDAHAKGLARGEQPVAHGQNSLRQWQFCSTRKKAKAVLVFTLSHRGNGSQLRRCWNLRWLKNMAQWAGGDLLGQLGRRRPTGWSG
jgi:hypothetical protein